MFTFLGKSTSTALFNYVLTHYRAKENANSEAEEFDQSAAFFTKVVSKKKKAGSIPEQPTGGRGKSKVRDNKGKDDDVSTRSCQKYSMGFFKDRDVQPPKILNGHISAETL